MTEMPCFKTVKKLQVYTQRIYVFHVVHIMNIMKGIKVHVTVHRDIFLIINQPDAIISQIYFGMKLYMSRTVSLSIIRSFSLYTQ